MQLEVNKEQLERDSVTAQGEADRLRESEDMLQATLDFTQGQMSQVQEELKMVKQQKAQIQQELHASILYSISYALW